MGLFKSAKPVIGMHSAHAITADVSLAETAAAVEFMRGDAVIVSGSRVQRFMAAHKKLDG